MLYRKTDEIFKEVPNVFGILNGILAIGYDSDWTDHDTTLCRGLQICRRESPKLNKVKCHSGVNQLNSLVRLFLSKA